MGRKCGILASERAELRRGAEAVRDALEHECQFRVATDCVELVRGYRSQQLPEPIPGRADAITVYWCTDGSARDSGETCTLLQEP